MPDRPLNPHEGAASAHELQQLNSLGEPFAGHLRRMYRSEPQLGADGVLVPIDETTRISVAEGLALVDLVRSTATDRTMEVGLAYGFSTVYLLAALAGRGGGRHVAIDPYQLTDWYGIGVTAARTLLSQSPTMTQDSLQLVQQPSQDALPGLRREGRSFGLIFIDGYHRFDDVLVDVTLAAPLCPMGGVIVLHDMWLGSIAAVASFLRTNRMDFAEVETGCDNLFAIRRVGWDERNWDHFTPFPTR